MIEWLNTYSSAINVIATMTLVSVTGYYAWLTRRILLATERQSKLSLDPVIGFEIESISISEVYGPNRRNMGVGLKITNVGNAPAIEVLVDAEIELRYSNISGEKVIPARFEPDMIPFLRPGEASDKAHPGFGNKLITHFFDDVRESSRLNIHRIETDPAQESHKTSTLRLYAYYRNSLGQEFRSFYQIEIGMFTPIGEDPIPKEDAKGEVSMIYIPRPKFHAEPVELLVKEKEIQNRNAKRKYSGW